MTTPLEGIRVLDFTRQMAGPYATVFLSDYGADVIKVESVPNGDGSRTTGVSRVGDQSGLFLMWNRGKRSLALDMRSPEALAAVHRLAREVDIVIENYRPGVADDIGIGYDELSALNPGLIYVSVSAFGEGILGPYPGTDPVVEAMSGVMSVTGEPDGGPNLVGVPMADFTGAMIASQAVLLGLLARQKTGKGQKIDVSMLYGMLSSLTTRLATYWSTGEEQTRHGSAHSVVAPYQAFQTSDGYAVAGVWGAGDGWRLFCEAIDMPELAHDERYLTNEQRVAARKELTSMLKEVFLGRTTAEWQEAFNKHRALFGPVHTIGEALAHPHVVDAGLVQTVQHPTAGEIPQLGPVIFLRETPGRIAGPPPLLGQHTREVLEELGYDTAEIDDLVESGKAGTPESLGAAATAAP